ncbi:MAG TPA: hypothetical protein DCO75_02460 [Fibrobacteres bacterium]|nr:hypothetical protein [Fibrobacterota bacterium]
METRFHIFLLPLILLCFCFSSKSNESNIQNLEFTVVDSLLQKPIIDKNLNISFRPPKHLNILESDSLKKMLKGLIADKGKEKYRYIFCDSLFNVFFIFGSASSFDFKNSDKALQSLKVKYHEIYPQSESKSGIFLKYPFRVHQIIVGMGKLTFLRMFFDSKKCVPFEVDFIIPTDSYSEQMKIVESVIGSISLTD